MARDYTAVPWEYLDEMEELSDEEFGRLIRGLLLYSRSGEPIPAAGNERFYVRRVMNREDRYQDSFTDISEVRREAGAKGAASRWNGKTIANDSKNGKAIAANGKNGNTETKAKTNTDTEAKYTPPPPPPRGRGVRKILGGVSEKGWEASGDQGVE